MLDEDEVIVDEAAAADGLSGVANTACPLTGKSLNEIDDPVMYVAFFLSFTLFAIYIHTSYVSVSLSLSVCVCVCVCVYLCTECDDDLQGDDSAHARMMCSKLPLTHSMHNCIDVSCSFSVRVLVTVIRRATSTRRMPLANISENSMGDAHVQWPGTHY